MKLRDLSRTFVRSFLLAAVSVFAGSQAHAQELCSTGNVIAPFTEGNTIKAGISVNCSQRVDLGGNLTLESQDPFTGDITQTWNRPYDINDSMGLPDFYVTLDCYQNPPNERFTLHRLHAFWGAYSGSTPVGNDEIITEWVDLGGCPVQ